ncbi:MAG: DUF4157 domain-containing protein [Flavipsychrobacter sp.]
MEDKRPIKISISDNAWQARLASLFLKSDNAAIVFGVNIYLWGASRRTFLDNQRWLLHELQHVLQYKRDGFAGFIYKYLLNHIKHGYYNNPYEVEARAAEQNEELLKQFDLT